MYFKIKQHQHSRQPCTQKNVTSVLPSTTIQWNPMLQQKELHWHKESFINVAREKNDSY